MRVAKRRTGGGAGAERERGYVAAILLALMTLAVLAGLLSELNAASASRTVETETGSATLLGDVRDALTAWSANHLDRPGGLPCPDRNDDGLAEATCDTEASRLGLVPWQTLGLATRPVADGEPLWYAVAAGYRIQSAYADPDFAINIASANPLAADRRPIQTQRPGVGGATVAADVAAVIIAPGGPIGGQTRPAGGVDIATPARYLEGRNANTADGERFDFGDYEATFNDRVVMLRAGVLFDVVEPAIEQRLRAVAFWNEIRRHNHPAAQDTAFPCAPPPCQPLRYLPIAVPFSNPTTSAFRDLVSASSEGLMPVGLSSADLIWTNLSSSQVSGPIGPSTVTFTTLPNRDVAITLAGASSFTIPSVYDVTADLLYAGRGFLQALTLPVAPVGGTATIVSGPTVTMNAPWVNPGRLTLTFRVSFTLGPSTTITLPAAQLNPAFSTESRPAWGQPTAWFMRNQWYRFVYYVAAPSSLPGGNGTWVSGPNDAPPWTCLASCLSLTHPVSGLPNATRDIALLYMGRALQNQDRATPASANLLANYLDTAENRNLDALFEQRVVRNAANDRVTYDPRP